MHLYGKELNKSDKKLRFSFWKDKDIVEKEKISVNQFVFTKFLVLCGSVVKCLTRNPWVMGLNHIRLWIFGGSVHKQDNSEPVWLTVFQLFNGGSSQIHVSWTIFYQYLTNLLSWHWRASHIAIPIILRAKGESYC